MRSLRDSDHKELPSRRREQKTVIYRVNAGGPVGCLLGILVSIVLLAALLAFALLGLITFTLVVWIACGLAIMALIGGILRHLSNGTNRGH